VTAIQKPKTMTNIKTKEKYVVPAKYRLTFKQSSVLRKKIAEMEVLPEDLATLEAPK
jgi:nucleoid DNA-binding protein